MHTAIPEVTPVSSFHDLTMFLVLSFGEKKRKQVEEILVKRENRLLDEFQKIKLNFHKLKEEHDNLQKELELCKDKSMKQEHHMLEYKRSFSEMLEETVSRSHDKNKELEYKMEMLEEKIEDLEYKIEVLEVHNGDLQNKVGELEVQNAELENKIEVLEVKYEDLEYTIEVLERQNEDLRNELGELEDKNEDLENKVEVLEVTKEGLVKKNEVRNDRLKKKWMVVEERLANVKAIFGSVCRGNDSHDKASNLEIYHTKSHASPGDPTSETPPQVRNIGSEGIPIGVRLEDSDWTGCHTKSQASFGNPSSKTPPQVESKGTEEITVCAHLGEGGGCSENSIKFKRKRSLYVSDDDKDSPPFNKKTKSLLESGCKNNPLSDDFLMRKVNPETPGISKSNLPPKFSSTSTERYEDKIGSHENSEPHFTRAISGSVDGINRSAGGDPHAASLENKVVAGFQSGKEIRWKYLADMLSAFEEDDKLCMAAVCALYRRNISARVSKDDGGFNSLDLVRGTDVAKYLINGDPSNKLRRSVEEVKQNRPPMLERCKALAIQNGEQLFEIYQKKLDPFWPKS